MRLGALLATVLLALGSVAARADSTDIQYSPTTSAGHDFNHAPIGQSFKALASHVTAGLFIADGESFTAWLAQTYPGLPAYPYAVAPSVKVKVQLFQGEGTGGTELHSQNLTLSSPYMGFVEVDYAAAGVSLVPGNMYTILLTDVSGVSYPNGVTGWIVPAVHDYTTGAALPPGAYPDGRPILQGALVTDDAGIGDNAFAVLDVGITAPLPLLISGTLPYGQVGQAYSATLSASGGIPPYTWSASGLPGGLLLGAEGTISGTPTNQGTFGVTVNALDSAGAQASATYSLVVSQVSCTKPKGAKASKGRGTVTAVGFNHVMVNAKRIDYAACTTLSYGGYATAPVPGDRVEWQGFVQPNGDVLAQTLTFN